jgi:hypothetical protein
MNDTEINFGYPIYSYQKLADIIEYLNFRNNYKNFSYDIIGYEVYQIKYKIEKPINKIIIKI